MKAGRALMQFSFIGQGPAGKAWLVTFTDLVCLMLTFFVMLYAMSDPDPKRFKALAESVPGQSAPRADGAERAEAAFTAEGLDRGRAIDLGYLGRVFESQLVGKPELVDVRLGRRGDALVVSLPGDLLFRPGSAELSAQGERALFILGGVAGNIGNALDVVGHADPTPTGNLWPSNWELSLARAQAVADSLRRSGYQREMTVRGHGDGRFAEVAPWAEEVERRQLARRVDLVIREHGSGR
ncbi:flagellar motor protein MotB [Aerophototrophica crusticola]|uniref:Flagellar motor protein MotB n=1 Tax=Aerophototrophica crusticola TaxID=1709002 RepID=A0A858R6D4_9PROT|nr:flagellar motor protein MotB [Rhodospirillaceae bacterium B3]